ncbi:MAG: serine/threonine protein kinase [Planctomycetes bacterium]|nr:serine/threonine protein kinase [Planctomycetota bacterium]
MLAIAPQRYTPFIMPDPVTSRALGKPAESPASEGRDTPSLEGTKEFRSARDENFPRPFGRYELRALLGRGGMGAVYLAHDPHLDRLVALKIPRLFDDDSLVWRERFLAEARAAATLHHPNICTVFEVGEVDSRPYLTMAYIEGETLAARLRRTGSPPIPEAIALVQTIARAMAEAHDRRIVHRDLKPANVIIDRRGQPVVMDFGLALRVTATDDLRLTMSGVAMGTPAYMPPEQAGGDHDAIGPPADVYALGVILYELVTHRLPFQGKTFGKLLAQIERDPPPLPSVANPTIDPTLEAIILRALEKAPEHRFATAGAFADALDAYSRGEHVEHDALAVNHRAGKQDARLTGPYTLAVESLQLEPGTRTTPGRLRRIGVMAGVIGVSLVALLAWVFLGETDPAPGLATELPDQPDPPAGAKREPLKPVESPKRDPFRPVEFPEQATLVRIPGWEILTDASKDEAQSWLDKRKEAKHSVIWLDAVQVGAKPVYGAVAATDERAADWLAVLDTPTADIEKTLSAHPGIMSYRMIAISGFERDGELRTACLLRSPVIPTYTRPDTYRPDLDNFKALIKQYGLKILSVRPFTLREGATVFAAVAARSPETGEMLRDLSAAELKQCADAARAAARRLTVVAAYTVKGELKFAAVSVPNPAQAMWAIDTGLTASELKEKSVERTANLHPAAVTGCAWDGAVRYCVVWVEDVPKK